MNLLKKHLFGETEAFQLGFGPVGPPVMSVFFYLIDGLLIDTGQRNMRKHVLELLRDKSPEQLVLTHHHEDHSANAAAIQKRHGLRVMGHPLTVKKMLGPFNILPYQHLMWGRAEKTDMTPLPPVVETRRFRFRPIHTPGHSKDHMVYLEENNGWLFSGDLYLGDRIKFFRSDERIRDQIASIKKVLESDFDALFCAHRPCLGNGKVRLQNKLNFLEDFYGKVLMQYQKGFSEKAIIRTMSNGSDRFAKWLTMGNVSFAHMVRSAIRDSGL